LYLKDFIKVITTEHKVLKILKSKLGYRGKVSFVDHHDAHAASAYYCSPYDKAAIITLDGRGEWATNRIYTAEKGAIKRFDEMSYPNSIGMVYENITEYLGFFRNSDEGKVMGLSSYGKPTYYEKMKEIIKKNGDWKYSLDLSFFNHHLRERAMLPKKFIDTFGPPRAKGELVQPRHADIASSIQKITNELMLAMARKAKSIRGDVNLCLAGGVALNAVANGIVYEEVFGSIFVQPASGDDGTSLGAAALTLSKYIPNYKIKNFSPYLGMNIRVSEINKLLKKNNSIVIKRVENPSYEAAKEIASGKIVGWFQGRAEFGPRALGNRSILADARNSLMKDFVNEKVKFREEFRPFAPAILYEYADEYFKLKSELPYMTIIVNVIASKRQKIPAVVHIDNTARVQTVTEKNNKQFYKLIQEFFSMTGVPVVLNTSFNVRGEPIVNTPKQAYNCFIKSGIDTMYIGNYEFKKND
jgi:carbamoyltransferase